jgi:LuxR family transcriptional regulator, maltose regulon positive regulatory protein
MPKAVSTLNWSAALATYVWSEPPSEEVHSLAPEGPAWFAWLAGRSSFAFGGQAGSYTARLEAVQRGERYWYAYRRVGQQVRKKYLGKTADLSLTRLEQVARLLQAEQASDAPPGTTLKAPEVPPPPPPPSEALLTPAVPSATGPTIVVEGPSQAQAVVPSDRLTPLLATRLHVPRSPARLVPRARLIERLSQGLSQSLLLVCAPAGFGKTTLLAQFLAACRLPAAWLSLQEEDNDPLRFLWAVLSALQSCDPALGAGVRALLSAGQGLPGLSLPALFAQLVGELTSREREDALILVLDDYHVLSSEPIAQAMAVFVEHCPPQLHLVIATRSDPVLPLARLRARGLLCELRAADLQFEAQEARHLLHTALQRELSDSTLASILSQTEGWVAGLQLLALALHGRHSEAEMQQVLAEAGGTHRYLVDYLVAEVLARQPPAVQSFLLHTCLLESLSAGLCAAVTGTSEGESAARLSELERANLFLFPADASGQWYRYHQLWAAVLRALLLRQLGAAGVAALYGRASRWYEQHAMAAEAIEAAMQAGEFARAAGLVEQLGPQLVARSQYYTLRRWIERLPHELWAARPMVCLVYAWSLFLSGALLASAAPLAQAEQLFRRQEQSVGLGIAAALRALAALMWARGEQALAAGQEALALLPAGDLRLRSVSASVVGGGSWLVGEAEAAWQRLVEARALHERAGNLNGLLLHTTLEGNVLALQGKLREASQRYQQVRQASAVGREFALEASIRQAALHYEWNVLEEAEAQLASALAESSALVGSILLGRGVLSLASVLQARLRQACGEHEAASRLFAQAVAVAQQSGHPRFLAQAQAAQVRFWLAQGQEEAVARWRDGWADTHEAAPSYEDEPGALTLARVLLAQGEPEPALRLLDGYHALARAQGRLSSELELLVLCARAEEARGQSSRAVQLLSQALTLAEPEGYVRLFVDEGVPLLSLLRQVASRWQGRRGIGYVRRLLGILQAEHPEQAGQLLSRPILFSARERTLLRLLAAGRSTAEMAAELVVSPNTIKAQRSQLYRKLNVQSREAALSEAVRLHLL